jgi:hypothetical protein
MPPFFVLNLDAQYVPIQQVTIVRIVQGLSEDLKLWSTTNRLVMLVKKSERG